MVRLLSMRGAMTILVAPMVAPPFRSTVPRPSTAERETQLIMRYRSSLIVLAVAGAAVSYGACTTQRLDPIGGVGANDDGGEGEGNTPPGPGEEEDLDGSPGKKDGSSTKPDAGDSGTVNTDWPCPPPGDGGTTLDREWMTGPLPKVEPTAANYGIRPNTVCDRTTHLEWQRAVPADAMTWTAGMAYCDSLSLEGATDWRLPTRIELMTLVDYSRPGPAIDPTAFPNTPNDRVYWISSILAGVFGSPHAYYISFSFGYSVPFEKTDPNRIRCVRGGR